MKLVVLSNKAYRELAECAGDDAVAIVTCDAYLDALSETTGTSRDELEQIVSGVGTLSDADLWVWFVRWSTFPSPILELVADECGTDTSTIHQALSSAADVLWPAAAP